MLLQDTWVFPDPISGGWPTPQQSDAGAQFLTLLFFFTIIVIPILWVAYVLRSRRNSPSPEPVVREPTPLVLIVCPYCGTKNEQGILKCRSCGAEM